MKKIILFLLFNINEIHKNFILMILKKFFINKIKLNLILLLLILLF